MSNLKNITKCYDLAQEENKKDKLFTIEYEFDSENTLEPGKYREYNGRHFKYSIKLSEVKDTLLYYLLKATDNEKQAWYVARDILDTLDQQETINWDDILNDWDNYQLIYDYYADDAHDDYIYKNPIDLDDDEPDEYQAYKDRVGELND